MVKPSAIFWALMDRAIAATDEPGMGASPEALESVLASLPDDAVRTFMVEFYGGLVELNRWELWGAGYVIAGGMSNDGFHYFRSWIIGCGREVYETALRCPDELGEFVLDAEAVENELLEYVALEVLEARGIDGDPRVEAGGFADDEPSGEDWSEDTVSERYPKLAARFL